MYYSWPFRSSSCQSVIPENQSLEGTPENCRQDSAAFSGGHLLDTDEGRNASGTSMTHGFINKGVIANSH